MITRNRDSFLRDQAIADWVGEYLKGRVTSGDDVTVIFTQEEMADRARQAIQLAQFLFDCGQIKPDPERYPV